MLEKTVQFFRKDLWRMRLSDLPTSKSIFIKQIRIIILALRSFNEDKCSLRASALTFYSLLSVVPAAALAFGVAKGFGLEKLLKKELVERMTGQEEAIQWIITHADSMLENTKGGLIAGVGVAIIFWLIIRLLGNIEKSFNEIWGISHSRKISRKLSDYLAIVFVCPVLLVTSSSITIFITTQITQITQRIDLLGAISPLILFSMKMLPYCVIWLLFTFIYLFMPNTKVRFWSGLLGGIVAGTIFVIAQFGYITFQLKISNYNAIYGSFAAIPFFMIWLQISWYIVLFGAEISFANQHVETYQFEQDSPNVSTSFKQLISIWIVHSCIKRFCNSEKAWSAEQISYALDVPIRLIHRILLELVQCQIISEIMNDDGDGTLFQPAHNVDIITMSYVIKALNTLGNDSIPFTESKELDRISQSMEEFGRIVEVSDANLLLKDI